MSGSPQTAGITTGYRTMCCRALSRVDATTPHVAKGTSTKRERRFRQDRVPKKTEQIYPEVDHFLLSVTLRTIEAFPSILTSLN